MFTTSFARALCGLGLLGMLSACGTATVATSAPTTTAQAATEEGPDTRTGSRIRGSAAAMVKSTTDTTSVREAQRRHPMDSN